MHRKSHPVEMLGQIADFILHLYGHHGVGLPCFHAPDAFQQPLQGFEQAAAKDVWKDEQNEQRRGQDNVKEGLPALLHIAVHLGRVVFDEGGTGGAAHRAVERTGQVLQRGVVPSRMQPPQPQEPGVRANRGGAGCAVVEGNGPRAMEHQLNAMVGFRIRQGDLVPGKRGRIGRGFDVDRPTQRHIQIRPQRDNQRTAVEDRRGRKVEVFLQRAAKAHEAVVMEMETVPDLPVVGKREGLEQSPSP